MPKTIEARTAAGGQVGRKGSRTRQALMDATRQLMEGRPIRDIRVADIARVAGTSPASFYRYFEDVIEAALAAAEAVEQMTPEMEALLLEPWPREEVYLRSHKLIETWTRLWERHRAILHFRNLAADEGDRRFADARTVATARVRELLEARLTAMHVEPIDAPALARVIIGIWERASASTVSPLRRKLSRARLLDGAAWIVALTFCGALPPGTLGLAEPSAPTRQAGARARARRPEHHGAQPATARKAATP